MEPQGQPSTPTVRARILREAIGGFGGGDVVTASSSSETRDDPVVTEVHLAREGLNVLLSHYAEALDSASSRSRLTARLSLWGDLLAVLGNATLFGLVLGDAGGALIAASVSLAAASVAVGAKHVGGPTDTELGEHRSRLLEAQLLIQQLSAWSPDMDPIAIEAALQSAQDLIVSCLSPTPAPA